jgi:transposase-like protein
MAARRGQLTRLGLARVQAVMQRSPSISAAARELGVQQSTVSRWVKSNRVAAPGRQRIAVVPPAGLSTRQDAAGEVIDAEAGA